MYKNILNRKWDPCNICKWGKDNENDIKEHCNKCNNLASEWEESNEFKQFLIGVNLSRIAKQISEQKEKTKVYPLLIMCTPEIKQKFQEINKEDAYSKGLEIIFIDSVYELEGFSNKYYNIYNPTPVFIINDSIKVRDWVYSKTEIMDNWKVFTCFPDFNHKQFILNSDPYQDNYKKFKKDILNLKLDKRFDQIALDSYDLNTQFKKYNIFQNVEIF